jgi:SET domain-containing protein
MHNGLRVSHSPKGGFGVFTDVRINSNFIVEQCHTLIIEDKHLSEFPSLLQHYFFQWSLKDKFYKKSCLTLGFGAIYNHSSEPNLVYKFEWANVNGEHKPLTTFVSSRDIEPGEELFVNYGDDYFKYFNMEMI